MSNWKDKCTPLSTITYDRREIEAPVGSIYKAISIIAKRSNQINADIRQEILDRLEQFSVPEIDSLEEVSDNKEQIEISRYYENLPKPHSIAISEWQKGKIYYRDTSEQLQG